MKIDYQCDKCGYELSNESMSSFICKLQGCGGQMRLFSNVPRLSPQFNAGWCDTLKCEVTSWKDQEKKALEHRSRSHPRGFAMVQDNKKWLKELKNIRNYKEDYLKTERPGYKFGEAKLKYDKNRPDIHRSGKSVYSFSK